MGSAHGRREWKAQAGGASGRRDRMARRDGAQMGRYWDAIGALETTDYQVFGHFVDVTPRDSLLSST